MQITPKTDKQIQEEDLIPAGEYDFTVREATEKKSKSSGNDMIQIDMDIFVDGRARPLKDYLMEAMAFKLRHFFYAIGCGDKYESGSFTADDCVGRSGKVRLIQKANGDYGMQNSVKDYVVGEVAASAPVSEQVATKAPSRPAPAPGLDEPPF